jgi:hypothetical protein
MISDTEKTRLAHKKILSVICGEWMGHDNGAEEQAIKYLAGLSITNWLPSQLTSEIDNYYALNDKVKEAGIVSRLGCVNDEMKGPLKRFFLDNKCDVPVSYKEKLKDIYNQTLFLIAEEQIDIFINKFPETVDSVRYLTALALKGRAVPEILEDKRMLGKFNEAAHSLGISSESGFVHKNMQMSLLGYLTREPITTFDNEVKATFVETKEKLSRLEQKYPGRN